MMIYETTKFDHSDDQYRLDVGDFTLLRMTLGRDGGAVKTATGGDVPWMPACPDRERLVSAMEMAVKEFLGASRNIEVRQDRRGRQFGEISGGGTRAQFFQFFDEIGARTASILGLPVT